MTPVDFSRNDAAAPLRIGPLTLASRVALAPMAGVTDAAFRTLARHWAPDSLIFTEMISANGIVYSRRIDDRILAKTEHDPPIAYQLAANNVDALLRAAEAIVVSKRPDVLDLNMGCPVKKITGNFEGCSLMRDPDRASALVAALVANFDTPVTVKFRLGWDAQSMNYLAFGQMCEAAGAQMVTLHARTRSQGYAPGCRWEAFGELKRGLRIPVIANGDITSADDARRVMRDYGVDGVMIGRAALGAPWRVGDIDRALRSGEAQITRTPQERLAACLDHARLHCAAHGEAVGAREMRKHLTWYVKGFPGASRLRERMTHVSSLADIERLVNDLPVDLALNAAS
ncbi:MAG: tRNA dihydrouridine synthase DusB [Vampirovibrionales bacterium]|nr:tRNA dihydrouridine synthase DusB [Vampirovibrionales bacterium]